MGSHNLLFNHDKGTKVSCLAGNAIFNCLHFPFIEKSHRFFIGDSELIIDNRVLMVFV